MSSDGYRKQGAVDGDSAAARVCLDQAFRSAVPDRALRAALCRGKSRGARADRESALQSVIAQARSERFPARCSGGGNLLSLVQLELPVKVVVFNNSAPDFIELEQKSTGFLDYSTGSGARASRPWPKPSAYEESGLKIQPR